MNFFLLGGGGGGGETHVESEPCRRHLNAKRLINWKRLSLQEANLLKVQTVEQTVV